MKDQENLSVPPEQRDVKARWRQISEKVAKFCGFYAKENGSGDNEESRLSFIYPLTYFLNVDICLYIGRKGNCKVQQHVG